MAVKLLYKALLWQSYPWSWKSWLSWRTRRSNLPSVSWGSMGTHQSWMAFMTRYPRITWRALFSLRAFFAFDARLSLSEKTWHYHHKIRGKLLISKHSETQTAELAVTEYNIWCITNDPQIITDREWLKRGLGGWEARQISTGHTSFLNDPSPSP